MKYETPKQKQQRLRRERIEWCCTQADKVQTVVWRSLFCSAFSVVLYAILTQPKLWVK